jgi:hypothetical protein
MFFLIGLIIMPVGCSKGPLGPQPAIYSVILSPESCFPSEAGVAHWSYTSGSKECTINGGKFSERIIYIYLAVFIFITAHQDAPKENTFNKFIDLRGLLKDL